MDNKTFVPSIRNVKKSYNANGQVLVAMDQYYNQDMQKWIPQDSAVYSYTEQGQLLSHYVYLYRDNQWWNCEAIIYEFDDKGRISGSLYLLRDGQYTWRDSQKEIRYYNANGQLDSVIFYGMRDKKWQYESKNMYKYNEQNQLEYFTQYSFSSSSNNWVSEVEDEFIYSERGLRTCVHIKLWRNGEWSKHKRIEYIYNENDLLIEDIRYTYDSPTDKYKYTYDSFDNVITKTTYSYDTSTWNWESKSVQTNQYDCGETEIPDITYTSVESEQIFNILGQPVDEYYHGIVIKNGKKMWQ